MDAAAIGFIFGFLVAGIAAVSWNLQFHKYYEKRLDWWCEENCKAWRIIANLRKEMQNSADWWKDE